MIFKRDEEDRLLRGHPWVYDNEIGRVQGKPEPGAELHIVNSTGRFLGTGLWSPQSKIRVRRYADSDSAFDTQFVRLSLERALAWRRRSFSLADDSCRIVFAEADGLPGLIVDRFVGQPWLAEAAGSGLDRLSKWESRTCPGGSWLSVQFLSRGVDERRDMIIQCLVDSLAPDGIMERSDAMVRRHEGLEFRTGSVYGHVPDSIVIIENGLHFRVDLGSGQKTGWFLDQQRNRAAVAKYADGRRVLDCFCNAGGFTLAAAANGASHVVAMDASQQALEATLENGKMNGLSDKLEVVCTDAFGFLRAATKANDRYGLIILDPPAFAKSKAGLEGAIRGYKEINRQAVRLLEPGGILASFSCSYWLTRERFNSILEDAASDAGKPLRYLEECGQPIDHPVISGYPESRYLKGAIVVAL
jgi:23S rRNA (cytosine1962-C5)-methyltransferase